MFHIAQKLLNPWVPLGKYLLLRATILSLLENLGPRASLLHLITKKVAA